MHLIAIINSSPREIILVILFILLILSDYDHQCALGVSTVQAVENTLCICYSPASLEVKKKIKHTALYFDIHIVYVSSTALYAANSKTECTSMDKLLQFLPCHYS